MVVRWPALSRDVRVGSRAAKLSMSTTSPLSTPLAEIRAHIVLCRCGPICCKTILSAPTRKIDSRSSSKAQYRFKSGCSRIRLFQIPIPQTSVGDFCNTKSARSRHSCNAPYGVRGLATDFAPFGRRPCDFAGMLDEELGDRAERAIL